MGILFKTYNRKHQLHVYGETWVLPDKEHLDQVLAFFSKKEIAKAQIRPTANTIEVEFSGLIVECKDLEDLKKKFGQLAEMKEKYQKVMEQKAKK